MRAKLKQLTFVRITSGTRLSTTAKVRLLNAGSLAATEGLMSEATKWNLVPLTPEYIEDEHGGYVAELENALKNDEIRNIALSGPYGVGKSSILRELARRQKDRVVELSLHLLPTFLFEKPLQLAWARQASRYRRK